MTTLKLYQPYFFAAAILIFICVLFPGCYTIKQGVTLIGYLNSSVPLEKADEDFAFLVNDIRKFAIEELGLTMSKNYTTYVELNRDYLAAVVSASAKDSFDRYEWSFPIVGKMPYKGFFNVEDAKKERNKLEKKDLDVWIRGVDAFSTLGWFKDPLYSYMKNYTPARLADLIIHESVHATVFIKNQVTFNEELAEFIGTEGARLYIKSRYGEDSEEYRNIKASEDKNKEYVESMQKLIAKLEKVYSSDLTREEKLIQKADIIGDMKINNAYLELFRLYYTEGNFYKDLYEQSGSDLPAFIAAAKKITNKDNPGEKLKEELIQKE